MSISSNTRHFLFLHRIVFPTQSHLQAFLFHRAWFWQRWSPRVLKGPGNIRTNSWKCGEGEATSILEVGQEQAGGAVGLNVNGVDVENICCDATCMFTNVFT